VNLAIAGACYAWLAAVGVSLARGGDFANRI
jgi:hypothetical protein